MSFTPNGTIRLLAGVPLDNTYTHTVRYADRAAQTAAFMAKGKADWTFEHCTYIREHRSIKVPICADDVIMCNYLMYQNLNYGLDKWFYAFITKVIYINDHNTEIEFEIDVMQTWMYDFAFRPCFVERNHTTTDIIGENILPEPIETGEPIIFYERDYNRTTFNEWDVIAYSTFDWSTWQPATNTGSINGGVFSALTRETIGRIRFNYPVSGDNPPTYQWITDPRTKLTDLINNHANLVEGVVAIVMSPTALESAITVSLSAPKPTGVLGTYTPRNKKLYTHQFTKLFVTDGNGSGKWYAFEDFDNSTVCEFLVNTDNAPSQTIICCPISYKGSELGHRNAQEAVVISGFPQCAWVSDAFKTYLAMNEGNISLSLASSASSVVVGTMLAASGGGASLGAGMITSGIMGAISTISSLYDRAKEPPKQHGSASTTTMMALGQKLFKTISYTCKPEYLKIADDFLSMYGYAICETMIPNIDARPNWTYIKTQGCLIVPDGINGFPSTDMKLIETIHDKGITYWKTMDNVGNYTLNNAPV